MYTKPEVTEVAYSIDAIQSDGKEVTSQQDNPFQLIATGGAYQADE